MRNVILLALLAAGGAAGAEPQAEGAVDTRIGLTRKLDVVLHNRARVRATSGEWFDVSLVPVFRYRANRSFSLLGGGFVTWIDSGDEGWKKVVRPFGGFTATLPRERFQLESRTLYERFIPLSGGGSGRYRQRFRIQGNGDWTPYANVEFLASGERYLTTRYGAGLRRSLGQSNGIEVGYWYETLQFTGGGYRHMIVTTFHFRFQGLAPDI